MVHQAAPIDPRPPATSAEIARRKAERRARKGPFANVKPGDGPLVKAKHLARWFVVRKVGKTLFRKVDELFAAQSRVGDPALFDTAGFPWVEAVEREWQLVRRELDGVLLMRDQLPTLQDLQPDQMKISPDDKWKTYVLWGFGQKSDPNCARCPETSRLLDAVPGLTGAWFSILAPGKHIPGHKGITKAMIRAHLPLKVPRERERCRMQVADEMVVWEEGKIVLFDDSSRHEVWNDTSEERVVLIFDFQRPMGVLGRAASHVLQTVLRLSPYARDARRNQLAWEERMRGLESAAGAA